MSMIFLAVGNAYMGMSARDADGNITTKTPPRWENDPAGGCVIVGKLDPETMEQDGPASVYGDYMAAQYLDRALELLRPQRALNIPDLKSIVQAAARDGDEDFLCEHCNGFNCRDCIITEWKEEVEDDG